jgi:AcrR family transcriptional regulator
VPPRQAPDPETAADAPTAPSGRAAQRRRTRNAIVSATRELIAAGKTPSIDDIAAAADVSRRTIYMYFPTVDQLVLDATAGLLSEAAVDAAFDTEHHGDDVLARTDALARAMVDLTPQTLPLGRKIIRLTVDAPRSDENARRGHRRMEWIERALEPLRAQVNDEQYERLASALAVVLGWEAFVVLEDVRALDPETEAATIRWMVRALVEATLAEGGATK